MAIAAVSKVRYRRDGGGSHSQHAPSHSHEPVVEDNYAVLTAEAYTPVAESYAPEIAAAYSAPVVGYGPAASGYGGVTGYDDTDPFSALDLVVGGVDLATTLLVPILTLLGLSIIFPNVIPLAGVRRKRTATVTSAGARAGRPHVPYRHN